MRAPDAPSIAIVVHVHWLDQALSGTPTVPGRVRVRLASTQRDKPSKAPWYVKAWCRYRGSTAPSTQYISRSFRVSSI